MKRFWKTTRVISTENGYAVELDGRPVKLPSGEPLAVPFGPLAEAIAEEWGSAKPDFTPDDLPLTRLASTAQERITTHRASIIGQLAAYGMNDLLCYRAEAPEKLAALQREAWDPWLRWANETHGLCLLTTAGIIPINQLPWTLDRLTEQLSRYSDYTLAALGVIVPALGSLVLGLALAEGVLLPQAACDTALLDEIWQEAQWGADGEATARRGGIIGDVTLSAKFMTLCAA